MHAEVLDFIRRMRKSFPSSIIAATRVLEYGSADVNGTPREFFPEAKEYVGVDWRPGPGVDAVSLMHKYNEKPQGYFDFAISTETLEHDPYWQAGVIKVVRLLAQGGSLLITCAGPGRHAHDVGTSPTESYYANPTIAQLASVVLSVASFRKIILEDDSEAKDLRLFGWRKQ